MDKIEQIKQVLREWFEDELPDGNDYMCRIRDIIDGKE